jgi:hypothetical protein
MQVFSRPRSRREGLTISPLVGQTLSSGGGPRHRLRRIGPSFGEGSDSTPGPPPPVYRRAPGGPLRANAQGGDAFGAASHDRAVREVGSRHAYRHSVATGTYESFEFDFDKRFAPLLVMLGAVPSNSPVELHDDRLEIRLGPWRLSSPTANVARLDVTGPYHWYRAIGLRLSVSDRGFTFGTNARRGLCVEFVEPVRSFLRLDHPAVTVTVGQPEMLKAAIEALGPGSG